MGSVLGRGTSLAAFRKTVKVEFEDMGLTVILRELSQGQMQNIVKTVDNDMTKQLALMIVDENGDQIYKSDEDLSELREMPWGMTDKLVKAATELNGISKEQVEQAVKNLQASQTNGSVSA